MRRVGGSLPVAPQVANAPGREQAHRTLYDDELLRTALGDRVGKCTPEGEDVKLMGRYLFDALIGHNAWEAVCEAARTAGDPLVELALTWAAADAELNLLKWEMMHDGTEFLAASRRCAVAITRVVRDAPEPEHPLESLTAPVRVLFVIGLGLADPDIRAGAEIMGLLRSVEQGKGAIVPYVLEQASIRALSREVQRFRPDVVHFIAHGRVSAQGGELLLRDDDDVSRAAPASAGRLLDALRCDEDTRLPHLVVVTVCDSASAYGDTVPLASELVKGGIPIVVGMTGVVSDPVCRLFSNRFRPAREARPPWPGPRRIGIGAHAPTPGLPRNPSAGPGPGSQAGGGAVRPGIPGSKRPAEGTEWQELRARGCAARRTACRPAACPPAARPARPSAASLPQAVAGRGDGNQDPAASPTGPCRTWPPAHSMRHTAAREPWMSTPILPII